MELLPQDDILQGLGLQGTTTLLAQLELLTANMFLEYACTSCP